MLTKALAKVEAAASEYRRAMDKINALGWNRGSSRGGAEATELDGIGAVETGTRMPRGFLGWLLAGIAFTLPLLLLLLIWMLATFFWQS